MHFPRKNINIAVFFTVFLLGSVWIYRYGLMANVTGDAKGETVSASQQLDGTNNDIRSAAEIGKAESEVDSYTEAEAFDPRQWLPIILNNDRPSISACFDRKGLEINIRGKQSTQYDTSKNLVPEKGIVDARTAAWIQVDNYPVVIEGGPDICFSGGSIWGKYPDSTDWETMHDTTGFTFRSTGKTTVENIRVHNYGDGISFSRGNPSYSFHITGAHMTHIRDDCVQNDYMYSGLIEDSLFDGCYTAFSAQTPSSSRDFDGSRNVWEIRNSLIRLEPMEKVYQDRGLIPGHGTFFKWNGDDNKSPQLALHNNIFRADQPSNSSSGFRIPEGKLVSCSNNWVIWLGDGPFPDPLPETFDGKPCFTVITDKTVWDYAIQNWLDHH